METLLCVAVLLMCLCALVLVLVLCGGLGLAVSLWRRDAHRTEVVQTARDEQEKAAQVLAQWDNLLDYDGSRQPGPKEGDRL